MYYPSSQISRLLSLINESIIILNKLDSLLEYKSSPDLFSYGEYDQLVVDFIRAFD